MGLPTVTTPGCGYRLTRICLGGQGARLSGLAGAVGRPALFDGRAAMHGGAALGRATAALAVLELRKGQNFATCSDEKIIGFIQLRKLPRQANQNTLSTTGQQDSIGVLAQL